MIYFALGLITSDIPFLFLQQLPTANGVSVGMLFVLILAFVFRRYQWLMLFCIGLCVGFLWIFFHASSQLSQQMDPTLINKTVLLRGHIATIPETMTHGVRFEFVPSALEFADKSWSLPGKVRLTWGGQLPILAGLGCIDNEKYKMDSRFRGNDKEEGIVGMSFSQHIVIPAKAGIHLNSQCSLTVGDEWQLQVRLKPANGTYNPGSFDMEEWLFAHGISATGYVVNNSANHLLQSNKWQYSIDRLRQYLAQQIQMQLADHPMTSMITALSVGVRNGITQEQWHTMRGTGTNHLMAIAGLHIGFVAGMTMWIMNFVWRRCGQWSLRIPTPQVSAAAGLVAAIAYSALAGFSLPTVRAVIMLAVFLCSVLLRRHLPPWRAFFIAMVFVLLLNPLDILSETFWLSFGAVAMILYGITGRLAHGHGIWQWGKLQWIVSIGLLPLSILYFQQIALAGIIANFIAIPWVGFVVLPLSLMGSWLLLINATLGGWLLKLAALAMVALWPILNFIAKQDWLQWYSVIPNAWIFIAAVVAVILLLAPRGFPMRWIGCVGLLPLFFWRPATPGAGEMWFTLLDVGQGLASVVQTQNHVLVYDTGPGLPGVYDMGESIVVPYLRRLGVHRVDMLVISHGDNDHSGGASAILHALPVQQILTSVPERFPLAQNCWQGQHGTWDGVNWQFLYPPLGQVQEDNNSSCVLALSVHGQQLLLTGDIESKSEHVLIRTLPQALASILLVAPHHGSATSSTQKFLDLVRPKYVLFPVGYLNRFHFPNVKVLARYEALNTKILDTANCGAIRVKFKADGTMLAPECFRVEHGHFWNRKVKN